MNLLWVAPAWALSLLGLLLVAAMVQDAVQLKISNWISGAVLALAILSVLVVGPTPDVWQNAAAFAAVFLAGWFLFNRGMLGGGDVKLFAAVAIWTAGLMIFQLVGVILLCGGALAMLILGARAAAPESWGKRVIVLRRRAGIPYGVAIATGTAILLLANR